jgi:CRP-like cAMP-binding protein
MKAELLNYLKQLVPISEELEKIINENTLFRTFKKGIVLLEEGKVSNECYFVLKGCIKRYYIIDGEEKITGFFTEGQFITPTSYTDRLPSKYFLSCVESTIASVTDPETEERLFKKHPELVDMSRELGEKLVVEVSNEFDNWVRYTPEERYLLLCKERPELVQRVPQYQLANYIGIKPQSLSRIRKRLYK